MGDLVSINGGASEAPDKPRCVRVWVGILGGAGSVTPVWSGVGPADEVFWDLAEDEKLLSVYTGEYQFSIPSHLPFVVYTEALLDDELTAEEGADDE